ncbi:MAG: hypothetical protein HRF50_03905 [Phycisphaerae bacterium]|jgi:hypothetical protein
MSDPAAIPDPVVERAEFARPGARAWVRVGAAATRARVYVNEQLIGEHLGAWTPFELEITSALRERNELRIVCEHQEHATAGFLPVLGVRWVGCRDVKVLAAPTPTRPPAAQRSAVRGTQLLLDGRPFRVRGVLHWGYYPELSAPWPDERQMRREITDLKSLGFNLIKFCLWIPPPRYYELCDELGMLVWQEYPVWNAPLENEALLAEYAEFFRQDGPYSCVILRTLTCENDRVDPKTGRRLIALCKEMIPGALVADNSGWLCSEREGDFHDEHPYLHNAQWLYYGARMRGRLRKPLLLGECMCFDTLPDSHFRPALEARRFQIELLAEQLPDAGYVVTGLRDTHNTPLGLYTHDGRLKYTPQEWSWHRDRLGPPRRIPPVAGEIIGPRKGQWKCPEHVWWSPIVRVHDDSLPRELIERECMFELLSGRVLSHTDGTRVLVDMLDVHNGANRAHPLVIEFATQGQRRIVSAFRHDTPAGCALWHVLAARLTPGAAGAPPPEIGPLVGTSIVLEDWEMSLDGRTWTRVKCDTPLVNGGRNVFEGWATFRTIVDYPGGARVLRCEAVGDFYEIRADARFIGEAGPRRGTWDGTRDVPREFSLDLPAGRHELEFRVRDWRAAGGMIGPVFLATDLTERIL